MHEQDNYKWQQRAKKHWIHKGNCNTHFFHACGNHCQRKNLIRTIKTNNNILLDELNDISAAFFDFYSKLFTTSSPSSEDIHWSICTICPVVTGEMNEQLSQWFTNDKVCTTLKQMGPLKSLGLDGFSEGFYQKHWTIVGKEVTSSV